MSPTPLRPSAAPQALTIDGADFQPGLALLVTPPSGVAFAVSGGSIHNVSAASFDASLVTSQPGTYTFVAENDDGNASAPYSVTVGSSSSLTPTIATVAPASITSGTTPLTLTFHGTNLLPGLSVTFAGPSAVAIQGQPVVAGSTAFTIAIVASSAGQYSVSVVNPNGALSNSVTIAVN